MLHPDSRKTAGKIFIPMVSAKEDKNGDNNTTIKNEIVNEYP
jgi:hypothetical protein